MTVLLPSVAAALDWAEAQLDHAPQTLSYGHGTDNAFADACVMLRFAMKLPFDADISPDSGAAGWLLPLEDTASSRFQSLIARRIALRIPTPYLTGEAYVQGLRLLTDPQVIVPRSLIGEWLHEGGLEPWLDWDIEAPISSVLDVCTGSGAIAIQAAQYLAQFGCQRVDAVDISVAAIDLAHRNVALHGLKNVVNVLQGDLYAPVAGQRYDIILSNPPYVNAASMQALPAEYRAEPSLALAGGDDGMDLVRRLITGAKQHLNPKGVLMIEIGYEADFFEAAFPQLPFTYCPVSAGDDLIVLIEAQHLP